MVRKEKYKSKEDYIDYRDGSLTPGAASEEWSEQRAAQSGSEVDEAGEPAILDAEGID